MKWSIMLVAALFFQPALAGVGFQALYNGTLRFCATETGTSNC